MAEFKSLEKPHIEMHKICLSAVKAFNRGDRKTAENEAYRVEQFSREIVDGLNRLEKHIE